MTTDAAMQADYCDIQLIRGRKVYKVTLEIPQEAGDAFVAMFGMPQVNGVPVALARLGTVDAPESVGGVAGTAPPKPRGGDLARRAGILCGEEEFGRYLLRGVLHPTRPITKDEAADAIRARCGVSSRAELDHNPEAARKFRELMAEYQAWRAQ